ncbi:MAG: hypothetical protein AAF449_06645 [Myxococcota bacterium]
MPTSTSAASEVGAPGWVSGELPELFDASTHLMVVGSGPTPEAAEADAKAKMMATVLGPEADRPFTTVPEALQSFAFAPGTERYVGEKGAYVRLIAQRVFVMDRLKAWEALTGVGALADDPPEPFLSAGSIVTDPSGHLESLVTTLRYGRAQAFVCARRMAVTTSTCTPTSVEPAREAVRAFGKALVLRPHFSKGVPYRPVVGPQAPVATQVMWKAPGHAAVPIRGVPVAFTGASGDHRVQSNGKGRADWALKTVEADARIGARFDAEALLGPEASLWSDLPGIEIGFRVVTEKTARMALYFTETGGVHHGRDALRDRLKRLGLPAPVALDPKFEKFFSEGLPDAARLRSLVDDTDGAFDLVAVSDMRSEFAGRMSRRSVWHEATGQIVVYDLWSGAQLGPVQGTEREAGIGESAASAKALAALGDRLGRDVAQILAQHYRGGAQAMWSPQK